MARGTLSVFEGLDRAGKSTQCEKLVADLQNDGVSVRHVRFPGESRSASNSKEVFVLFYFLHGTWCVLLPADGEQIGRRRLDR